MRISDFDFNLRELAGSMGDLGTLLPLAIGYFAVNGPNPSRASGDDGASKHHYRYCLPPAHAYRA